MISKPHSMACRRRALRHGAGLPLALTVRPQSDGTTRVEFRTRSEQRADTGISQHMLSACNLRTGR